MAFDKNTLPVDDFIGEGVVEVEKFVNRSAPGAEVTDSGLIPADQVKPEEIAKLSIEYRDGKPVIVVGEGKYVPAELAVVNSSGNAATGRFAWADGHAVLHTPDSRPTPEPVYHITVTDAFPSSLGSPDLFQQDDSAQR